jgi:hypothetical protein
MSFLPNGSGPLPHSALPVSSGGTVTGASSAAAGFSPGDGPPGGIRMREVWPLSATPLALAALPDASACAALRSRLVAAEWGLGSLGVAAEQAARGLAVAAVVASAGLPGQPVVRLWLRSDGRRMLIAVWDGCPQSPAWDNATQWPFAGIAVQRGWHEHEGGKTCWSVLSWRDARPGFSGADCMTTEPMERKGDGMANGQCSCGFTETASVDETLADHLMEVFAPDDGKGPDGRVHLEGEVSLFCLCGIGGSAERLDDHLLAVFTPADAIGRDGHKHERLEAW